MEILNQKGLKNILIVCLVVFVTVLIILVFPFQFEANWNNQVDKHGYYWSMLQTILGLLLSFFGVVLLAYNIYLYTVALNIQKAESDKLQAKKDLSEQIKNDLQQFYELVNNFQISMKNLYLSFTNSGGSSKSVEGTGVFSHVIKQYWMMVNEQEEVTKRVTPPKRVPPFESKIYKGCESQFRGLFEQIMYIDNFIKESSLPEKERQIEYFKLLINNRLKFIIGLYKIYKTDETIDYFMGEFQLAKYGDFDNFLAEKRREEYYGKMGLKK
jgi:hypothetical protein